MPGLLQASDDAAYVVKMRGAGQGPRVLVTELIAAAVVQLLGLPMPETVVIDIPDRFGINEPDPEIRDLLRASVGANVGLAFLPEATTFDAGAGDTLSAAMASTIVWLDSFLLNVDRTARNPNLLLQHSQPFLIDHGASLYPQYNPESFLRKAELPFAAIASHLLLAEANDFSIHAGAARGALSSAVLAEVVDAIPEDVWPAGGEAGAAPVPDLRALYREFLSRRLDHAAIYEAEVLCAQSRV